MTMPYDALLVVSFGGPERRDDVVPFLENVLRGKGVPRERMLEVAGHYYRFQGRSPINDQVRALLAALTKELAARGVALPVYWGNRNWHPMLSKTVARMRQDGVRRALAFVTSAWSSNSSCRQYLENIGEARRLAGEGAPEIDKIPPFGNDPAFLEILVEQVGDALKKLPGATILYTAHSIPLSMASGCRYEEELTSTARSISARLGCERWRLVYQSRSGPTRQSWLEPDICAALRELAGGEVVLAPIGFLSDHLEVLYDLDVAARAVCDEMGIRMVRCATAGAHGRFAAFVAGLMEKGLRGTVACKAECCPR